MNKSELIAQVAGEMRTSRLGAARIVDTVFDTIKKELSEGESVTICGFGTFEVKPRKARVGRNPRTGEPIRIEAGRRVGFRVGKSLKQAL